MNKYLQIAQMVRHQYDRTDKQDLHCKCAIVSVTLSEALRKRRLPHTIVYAQAGPMCHVFVTYENDHGTTMMLDLTASQFKSSLPPIVHRQYLGDDEPEWYWMPSRTFKSAQALTRHQIRDQWPEHQIHPKWRSK